MQTKSEQTKEYTVLIEGMTCGMCEAHICDVIRNTLPAAKKVQASRKHGTATFLYSGDFDETVLKNAVNATGYTFVSVTSHPYQKRGLYHR